MKKLLMLLSLCAITAYGQKDPNKIPRKIEKDIPALTAYLCVGKNGKREKTEAIYKWITENIEYDYKRLLNSEYFTGVDPNQVLKSKKAICNDYVELMKAMLDEVGIENQTVEGYTRDEYWAPGQLCIEETHAWIAVKLEDGWHLADPTWDAGYIGRIPYDRKPYKPKKYIKNKWKNSSKEEEVLAKRAEIEKKRKEEYDSKPQFKDQIGFVQNPKTKYFLANPDTFLIEHLPVDPMWQLKDNYLSIAAFSQHPDSLRASFENTTKTPISFNSEIADYQGNNYLNQLLIQGEKGFAYNPHNPSIKALKYYNYMVLVHHKKIQKLARGSQYEITTSAHSSLSAMNDTIIKYAKLYKKAEKDIYKNHRTIDKDLYKSSSTHSKDNRKLIKKIEAENEKLVKHLDNCQDKIDDNLETFAEQKNRILDMFPAAENPSKNSFIKKEVLKPYEDSIQMQIDGLKTLQSSFDKLRDSTSFNHLLSDVEFLKILLEANAEYIKENNYLYEEQLAEIDSLIDTTSAHALMLFTDSLRLEILDKQVLILTKEAKSYVRKAKTYFKNLELENQLSDPEPYNAYMHAKLYEAYELAEKICSKSAGFHEAVLDVIDRYPTFKENTKLIEEEIELREEKYDFVSEYITKRHERSVELLKDMEEDTKKWKELYNHK